MLFSLTFCFGRCGHKGCGPLQSEAVEVLKSYPVLSTLLADPNFVEAWRTQLPGCPLSSQIPFSTASKHKVSISVAVDEASLAARGSGKDRFACCTALRWRFFPHIHTHAHYPLELIISRCSLQVTTEAAKKGKEATGKQLLYFLRPFVTAKRIPVSSTARPAFSHQHQQTRTKPRFGRCESNHDARKTAAYQDAY